MFHGESDCRHENAAMLAGRLDGDILGDRCSERNGSSRLRARTRLARQIQHRFHLFMSFNIPFSNWLPPPTMAGAGRQRQAAVDQARRIRRVRWSGPCGRHALQHRRASRSSPSCEFADRRRERVAVMRESNVTPIILPPDDFPRHSVCITVRGNRGYCAKRRPGRRRPRRWGFAGGLVLAARDDRCSQCSEANRVALRSSDGREVSMLTTRVPGCRTPVNCRRRLNPPIPSTAPCATKLDWPDRRDGSADRSWEDQRLRGPAEMAAVVDKDRR